MTTQLDAPLPKKTPQVDLDRTRERLIRLGLVHAADRLGEHVATAAKETHPPHRFLDTLSPFRSQVVGVELLRQHLYDVYVA